MYQQPTAPQSIGGLLDSAIRLFKTAWIPVLAMTTACAAASSLPSLFGIVVPEPALAPTPANELAVEYLQATGLLLTVYLITLPFVLLFGLGLIAQMHAMQRGNLLGWRGALAIARRRFLQGLLCTFLLIVTIGAVYVGAVFVAVAVFLSVLTTGEPNSAAVALLLTLTLILTAAIPTIVLIVYWAFAVPLIVTENLDTILALGRSWKLVRRHWWRTLLVLTIASFIIVVLTILVSAGAYIVTFVPSALAASVILFVINTLSGMVTTPLLVAVLLATLHDLTMRRGGDDLQRRIQAVDR